jgi:Eukaryotic cytochrome b561
MPGFQEALRPGSIYAGADKELPTSSKQADQAAQGDPFAPTALATTSRELTIPDKLTHALVAALVVSMVWDQFKGNLFSYHPVFMSLGYLGFMTEGISLAIGFRRTDGPARVSAIWRHAAVQLAAALSIAIGFWAIYRNKARTCLRHLA